jgi:hypothetical protein
MSNPKKLFIERLLKGNYGVKESNVGKPIATAPTQAKAIAKAQKFNPKELLVERVRDTKVGGRDKWRKP